MQPTHWTEYLGGVGVSAASGTPYLDFDAEADPNVNPVPAATMRYLGGFGTHARQALDPNDPNAPGETLYLHGDLIGSTMLLTDEGGAGILPVVAYTAFGEPVGPGGVGVPPANMETRYQYGGGYGYESGLISLSGVNPNLPPITLQHVGERWYQPGVGRFVQRDPIGIWGGINVYSYCAGNPIARIDPMGWDYELPPDFGDWLGVGTLGGALGGAGSAAMAGGSLAAVGVGAASTGLLGALTVYIGFGGKGVCIETAGLSGDFGDLKRAKEAERAATDKLREQERRKREIQGLRSLPGIE